MMMVLTNLFSCKQMIMNFLYLIQLSVLKCSSDCLDQPCVESIINKITFAFEKPETVFLKKSL